MGVYKRNNSNVVLFAKEQAIEGGKKKEPESYVQRSPPWPRTLKE
jgi:hypothetical protein